MGKVKNPGVKETLKSLVNFLVQLKKEVKIDAETAQTLADEQYPGVAREQLSKECDLLIVVGGDGSLLQAAHAVIEDEVPLLGVNRGRLGFLTDIHPAELEKIKAILAGQFILEKRFLLTASVSLDEQKLGVNNALNEVALIPDMTPHMYEFEIYVDDKFVLSQASDGVIVATPTGSTAYALSGGGPILHPQLDAIVIVPMFPHTLSIRPIVLEANQVVKIMISPNNTATPRLTCDGQAFIPTPPASQIKIAKKPQTLHLIHPLDYDYYGTLRSKLHWGQRLHSVEE
jgi:NAD+ kinase